MSADVALARIRQLSAHEVGHTIGFSHNFAASTYADRASVMDYPAPRVLIRDGELDLSDAYGVGIGEWDKFAVQYAYSEFPENEEEQLQELISGALSRDLLYITDADARPAGAAHPLASLWDNGSDPVEALKQNMAVRRIALQKFSAAVLAKGLPLSELEKVFVPVYLHHRYQVEATAKTIGGYEYTYAVNGDEQVPVATVPQDRQLAALQALLATLSPSELVISQDILRKIPPQAMSSINDLERFQSQTAPMFDPGHAIKTAAELTIGSLLQPQRISRLVNPVMLEEGRWTERLTLQMIVQGILTTTQPQPSPVPQGTPQERLVGRIAKQVLVDKLIALAESSGASTDARAEACVELRRLQAQLRSAGESMERAHNALLGTEIERFLNRNYPEATPAKSTELPPGSPIGADLP